MALEAAFRLPAGGPPPLQAVEARVAQAALCATIASLSAAKQHVVLLDDMGDRSQAEIAALLHITPNAAKTRLYGARRRVRTRLAAVEAALRASRPSAGPRFSRRFAA